jgi:IS30 family transposase
LKLDSITLLSKPEKATEDGIQASDKGATIYDREVAAETIYRWIWQEKRRGNDEMARNLRHRGRRKRRRDSLYRSRGIIQDRVDISLRPLVVDEKKRFGDFEIDTMIDKNRRAGSHYDDKRQVHASGADPQACWERSHPAGQCGNRSAATL